MSDRLVTIARYVTAAEADLARMQLGWHGIDSTVGNAVFVTWFWYYSNAVGGVTLDVLAADADRAYSILHAPPVDPAFGEPVRICPRCREESDESWQVCWRCGASEKGDFNTLPGAEESAGKAPSETRDFSNLVGLAALAIALLVVASGLLVVVMVAVIGLILVYLLLRGIWGDATPGKKPLPDVEDEGSWPDDPFARRRELAEKIALRAWQSSLLGAISFPPLLLYSAFLLFKLGRSSLPVTKRCIRWRLAAFLVNLPTIPVYGIIFVVIVGALLFIQVDYAMTSLHLFFNFSLDHYHKVTF